MYRRELIGEYRQDVQVSWGEDIVYNYMVLGSKSNIKAVSIDSSPLYYYYQRSNSITKTADCRTKWLFVEGLLKQIESIQSFAKRSLSIRYASMFVDQTEPLTKPDYDRVMEVALQRLVYYHSLRPLQRLIIIILWRCPVIYRLLRIMNDPTLIKWEKGQLARKIR